MADWQRRIRAAATICMLWLRPKPLLGSRLRTPHLRRRPGGARLGRCGRVEGGKRLSAPTGTDRLKTARQTDAKSGRAHALLVEIVRIRRLDPRTAVAAHVAYALVGTEPRETPPFASSSVGPRRTNVARDDAGDTRGPQGAELPSSGRQLRSPPARGMRTMTAKMLVMGSVGRRLQKKYDY